MKILIFDTDVQNYHFIHNVLVDYDERYEVIGPFTTIEQCRDYLLRHKDIDIIITDVMLGNDTIFDVLNIVPSYVPLIFVTSHEEFALRAFEYYSLSYLVKPVDESYLVKAISKAVRLRKVSPLLTPQGSWSNVGEEQSRMVVRTFNGERIIHFSTIRYIVSEQKNTYIKLLDGNSYRIDKTLDEMTSQLGERFKKVNRKYIVPLEQVLGTERRENGKLLILLKGKNSPNIIVSRTRKREVCEWLKMS
jgi:two-component system LytT family response regulator